MDRMPEPPRVFMARGGESMMEAGFRGPRTDKRRWAILTHGHDWRGFSLKHESTRTTNANGETHETII